ncbi:PAS domain-containing protein [Patescibacteria group bacterium]
MGIEKQEEVLRRYKVLTETSPDCIKLMDVDGNLTYINPGGIKEHDLGSLENALETRWKMIDSVVGEDVERVQDALDRAKAGEVVTIEVRHTRDGSDRDVCMETIAPVVGENGKVEAIFGVSRDITDMKKVEDELIRVKNNLEEEVKKRTMALEQKVSVMERINNVLVNRELEMIKLKKEIKQLRGQLGESEEE